MAGTAARVFAFIGALLFLLLGAVFSLGAVLAAPLGMVVAGELRRGHGRGLSGGGRWLAASTGVAIVLLGWIALGMSLAPRGALDQIKRTADSTQTASARTPPPAWIDRMYPGMSQRAAQTPQPSERALTAMVAASAAFGFAFAVAFFGTVGWAGGMFLGLAVRGRWPGTVAPESPPA